MVPAVEEFHAAVETDEDLAAAGAAAGDNTLFLSFTLLFRMLLSVS